MVQKKLALSFELNRTAKTWLNGLTVCFSSVWVQVFVNGLVWGFTGSVRDFIGLNGLKPRFDGLGLTLDKFLKYVF